MFDDIVNELAPLFEAADGLVIASPVYYASASDADCLSDRLFYSTSFDKEHEGGCQCSLCTPEVAAQRLLMNKFLPSAICRSHPADTGTVFTAVRKEADG